MEENLHNTPELMTERLVLRRFRPEDAQRMALIWGDEQVNRFLPMFPLKSVEQARTYIQREYIDTYTRPQGYRYAICLKESGLLVGYVKIETEEPYELGYGLAPSQWRQGITTEAARAVVEQARRDGIPYITATHDVHNPYSGAVMRKIGMQYGYSYEEQWQPKDFLVVFQLYQMSLDGKEQRFYQGYWQRYARHWVEEGL